MKELVFYSQLIILLLNVITFIYLLDTPVNHRTLRVLLLITFTIGLIVTFGRVTWFSVLFSFAPSLSLINITADGNIGRGIKKFRAYFRRHKQPMEGLERSNKTLFD